MLKKILKKKKKQILATSKKKLSPGDRQGGSKTRVYMITKKI